MPSLINKMISRLEQKLLNSVWALAGVGFLSLISTRELEPSMLAAIVILYPILYALEQKNRLKKYRIIENSLILAFFFLSILRIFAMKGSFLIVVADFLIAFTFLKLAFRKEKQDLTQIIALSFFLLLSASTLALDFTFLLIFVLYVPMVTWTLSLHTLMKDETADDEGKHESVLSPSLIRNSILTLTLTLIFSVTIFVFFPRLSLTVFQGAFLGPAYKAGFTDKMHLAKSGGIFEDSTVAMRVEMDGNSGAGPWYLRGQTLSIFDGQEWTSAGKNGDRENPSQMPGIRKVLRNRFQILSLDPNLLKKEYAMQLDESSFIKQKIYLESVDTQLIFGLPRMVSLTARLPEIRVNPDESVLRPNGFSGRMVYEAVSFVEKPNEKILIDKAKQAIKTGGGSDPETIPNLQLPDMDFARIRALTKKVTSRRDSPYTKAIKIEQYLRKNYLYTLNLNARDQADPVDHFLFTSKRGTCEYFASAMALMMRLEGIPTRIATGFLMTEWNPSGKYFIVRAKDAHSWIECYLGGMWIQFDPTPRGVRTELSQTALSWMKQKVDYLNFLWNAHVLSYDVESQRKVATAVQLKSNDLSIAMDRLFGNFKANLWKHRLIPRTKRRENDEVKSRFRSPLKWIGWVIAALAFLGTWRYRSKFKLSRFGASKKLPAPNFYSDLLKILAKKGFKKKHSETPGEFIDRLSRNPSISSNTLTLNAFHSHLGFLTQLFYRVRFAGIGLSDGEQLTIQNYLKEIKILLKKVR